MTQMSQMTQITSSTYKLPLSHLVFIRKTRKFLSEKPDTVPFGDVFQLRNKHTQFNYKNWIQAGDWIQ